MKHLRFFCICVCAFLSFTIYAQVFTYNGIRYRVNYGGNDCSVVKLEEDKYSQIEIPNTVRYEGKDYAVTAISQDAFTDCEKLSSLFIPSNIKAIDSGRIINNCPNLYKITVDSRNENYDSREGSNAVIETNSNRLIVACNGTVVPSSVWEIGPYAYNGYTKSSIYLPPNIWYMANPFCGYNNNVRSIVMSCETNINPGTFQGFYGVVSFYGDEYHSLYRTFTIEKDGHNYCAPDAFGNWTENGLIYSGGTLVGKTEQYHSGLLSSRCCSADYLFSYGEFHDVVVPELVHYLNPPIGREITLPNKLAFLSTTPPEVRYSSSTNLRTDHTEIHVPKGARTAYISDAFFSQFNIIDDIEAPANFTGKCGENATYTMDLSGGVYISGTGKAVINVPLRSMLGEFWREIGFSVEPSLNIYIENGITFVYAEDCNSIALPGSVENVSLHEIQYICGDSWNTNLCFDDGVVYDKDKTKILAISKSKAGELEIPSSVTTIDHANFSEMYGLTKVVIPDGVTSIGSDAFSGCVNLAEVNIPNGVTSIGSSAFSGCSSLTEINIPRSVTSIESSAFYGCSSLTEINIPGSVTKIGSNAFNGCSELTYVDIPSGVTNIEYGTFYGCTNLSRISVPNSVTSIGSWAFGGCEKLTSLTIPQNVAIIGQSIVKGCCGLKKIVVDARNTEYDSRNNCNAIIETKTNALIAGCNTTVLPEEITSIGEDAFYNCKELKDVNIPSGVTSIGNNAFNGCETITRIDISSGVTSIGSGAFNNCKNLATISVMSETPLKLSSGIISYDMKKTCTLIVPQGCLNAYKQANGWKDFANIIEVDTDIALLDNAIYVEGVEALKGNDVDLVVKLKNSTMDVTAFSFNLVLPKGFSVTKVTRGERLKAMDDDDEYIFSFANSDKDGVRYVHAYTTDDAVLNGKDGEIVRVTISMPEDVTAGEYPIIVADGEISYYSSYVLNDMVRSTLTVNDYMVGDANGDGRMSISDVSAIAGYLLGKPAADFMEKAADANMDGRISITDVSTITGILLGK